MFLSTEIFSKRRKIYSWIEEKPELAIDLPAAGCKNKITFNTGVQLLYISYS